MSRIQAKHVGVVGSSPMSVDLARTSVPRAILLLIGTSMGRVTFSLEIRILSPLKSPTSKPPYIIVSYHLMRGVKEMVRQ